MGRENSWDWRSIGTEACPTYSHDRFVIAYVPSEDHWLAFAFDGKYIDDGSMELEAADEIGGAYKTMPTAMEACARSVMGALPVPRHTWGIPDHERNGAPNGGDMVATTFDFGDGPVPAHKHSNGGGWVANTAEVSDTAFVGEVARVYDEAGVSEKAWIGGQATVCDGARVFGHAWVRDKARVSGDAEVYGGANVYGGAQVSGRAKVFGNARVAGKARISGSALVSGDAWVFEKGHVSGEARARGRAVVCGESHISGDANLDGTIVRPPREKAAAHSR